MLKTFPVEFVRQALEQTMLKEHIKNENYFGGINQISLISFYQQLKNQSEVDRFVETFREIVDQQNRSDLIGNGIILSPENPTITNLYSCLVIPMTWTCSMRCTLANRDQMLETINKLIEELKGSKCDIAQLNCVNENGKHYCQPFMVGTIGHNEGAPKLNNGDYIGHLTNAIASINRVQDYKDNGVEVSDDPLWVYCEHEDKLKVLTYTHKPGAGLVDGTFDDEQLYDGRYIHVSVQLSDEYEKEDLYKYASATVYVNGDTTVELNLENGIITNVTHFEHNDMTYTRVYLIFDLGKQITSIVSNYEDFDIEEIEVYEDEIDTQFIVDDGTYEDIIFPPEHDSFEKFKLSMSFDSLRCDTPNTLNSEEYCEISFGGSATLVNESIRLGNDLVKVSIAKNSIKTSDTPITYSNPTKYWVEPLEMPSGNNANTKINQLVSNKFLNNSHTDAISLSLQYTFIADLSNQLLKQWYDYGRYGTQYISDSSDVQTMTPNLIYEVNEIYSTWGEYEVEQFKAKLVESVDIDNTEGDTMTISVTMQIQGDND